MQFTGNAEKCKRPVGSKACRLGCGRPAIMVKFQVSVYSASTHVQMRSSVSFSDSMNIGIGRP